MACGHSPICAGQVSTSQETTTKFGTKTNYYWQQREKAWISIQTWELWPSNLVTPGQGRERHVRRVKWEHGKKGHCLRALDSLWIKWSFWFLGFSHLIHFYVFNFIKKKNSFILNVIFHQQIKFKKYYRHYCYRRVYLSIQDYFKHSPCAERAHSFTEWWSNDEDKQRTPCWKVIWQWKHGFQCAEVHGQFTTDHLKGGRGPVVVLSRGQHS